MKKTLFLSVAASTLIMAGGDIAPVQPAVATPAPAPVASGWDFGGQAVVYYQTNDQSAANDLFDQASSRADAGLQLRATNNDVFAGIGAGFEVNGLSTLNLENYMVGGVMQATGVAGDIDDVTDGGWISQAYLTYAVENTSFKLGRQELPKALSPFAFSEGWNVFKNTFDAALVVNTDIQDTTLVGAWVGGNNVNGVATNMSDFNSLNGSDGVYMLTVQNKSIDNLTLTGSVYYGANYADNNLGLNSGNELVILWGDAKFNVSDYSVALQGGTFMDDDFADDSVAFGAKIGADFGMFDASLAYSNVNDGGIQGITMVNTGGVKTPLYTQMILNQSKINFDNDTIVARVGTDLAQFGLDGKLALAYDMTTDNSAAGDDYTELDLTYKTKVLNNTTDLFAGYIFQDQDSWKDGYSTFRVWGRYNF